MRQSASPCFQVVVPVSNLLGAACIHPPVHDYLRCGADSPAHPDPHFPGRRVILEQVDLEAGAAERGAWRAKRHRQARVSQICPRHWGGVSGYASGRAASALVRTTAGRVGAGAALRNVEIDGVVKAIGGTIQGPGGERDCVRPRYCRARMVKSAWAVGPKFIK